MEINRILSIFFVVVYVSLFTGCVTTRSGSEVEVKKLDAKMSMAEILELTIQQGGPTLEDAKHILKDDPLRSRAESLLEQQLISRGEKYTSFQAANAIQLYRFLKPKEPEKVFLSWMNVENPVIRQFGWEIAAVFPSRKMATSIEKFLSKVIAEGEEAAVLIPEMARAVRANGMSETYSLLRMGLLEVGSLEFVEAMATLNPKKASDDFLLYLKKAPVEELRQLNMISVNVYSCMAILRHLLSNPPSVSHPDFSHLFLFGISRNTGLADLAVMVVSSYVPNHREHLALMLSRMPVWVQLAYLEKIRRDQPEHMNTFIAALKEVASQPDVVSELEGFPY